MSQELEMIQKTTYSIAKAFFESYLPGNYKEITGKLLENFISNISEKFAFLSKKEKDNLGVYLDKLIPLIESTDEDQLFDEIPLEAAILLFYKATMTANSPFMSECIAKLTLASIKKKTSKTFHPRHIQLLSSLTDQDFHFLQELYLSKGNSYILCSHNIYFDSSNNYKRANVYDIFPKSLEKFDGVDLIQDNLLSLGLIRENIGTQKHYLERLKEVYLNKHYTKTKRKNHYRYNKDSTEVSNILTSIPKEDEYTSVMLQSSLREISPLGYFFINHIFEENKLYTEI